MAGDAPDSNFTISLPSIRRIPFELLDAARAQTTRISTSLNLARPHTLSLSAGLKGCWCSFAWLRPLWAALGTSSASGASLARLEPNLFDRRPVLPEHAQQLNRPDEWRPPQHLGLWFAHLCVCCCAAGQPESTDEHRCRINGMRCSPTPRREHIILAAIDTYSTRRVQNDQARSRCVLRCGARASGV